MRREGPGRRALCSRKRRHLERNASRSRCSLKYNLNPFLPLPTPGSADRYRRAADALAGLAENPLSVPWSRPEMPSTPPPKALPCRP